MDTDDVTKVAAVLDGSLDSIDGLAKWSFGQTTASIAGALALLPRDSYDCLALNDRLGSSKEARARLELAHSLKNVRLLLEGIKHHCDDLENSLDCELERLRDAFGVQTEDQLKTLAGVAKLSTKH